MQAHDIVSSHETLCVSQIMSYEGLGQGSLNVQQTKPKFPMCPDWILDQRLIMDT